LRIQRSGSFGRDCEIGFTEHIMAPGFVVSVEKPPSRLFQSAGIGSEDAFVDLLLPSAHPCKLALEEKPDQPLDRLVATQFAVTLLRHSDLFDL
jgi:hypothetical protein